MSKWMMILHWDMRLVLAPSTLCYVWQEFSLEKTTPKRTASEPIKYYVQLRWLAWISQNASVLLLLICFSIMYIFNHNTFIPFRTSFISFIRPSFSFICFTWTQRKHKLQNTLITTIYIIINYIEVKHLFHLILTPCSRWAIAFATSLKIGTINFYVLFTVSDSQHQKKLTSLSQSLSVNIP